MSEKILIACPPDLRLRMIMEHQGIRDGYHAEVDSKTFGYPILSQVVAYQSKLSTTKVDRLLDFFSNVKNIRGCGYGHTYDAFVLIVVARDWEDYDKVLSKIAKHESVETIHVYILSIRFQLMKGENDGSYTRDRRGRSDEGASSSERKDKGEDDGWREEGDGA
jgi:DNA-binding Lrp family transcriptional regulator